MFRVFKILFFTFFMFISSYGFADINDSGVRIKWGYEGNIGPTRWGQLDPQFALCATGKLQSPINIPKKFSIQASSLSIHYRPAPMIIMDDGETILQIGKTQLIINDGQGIQLNFPSDQFNESITYRGKDYRLVQFHIHTPSENQLKGQAFPMEIHFVHQSEEGELVVIAVFFNGGAANPSIQKIVDNIPLQIGKQHEIPDVKINPLDLLPEKKDYFSFTGSLTTPPCIEGVEWIVMTNTMNASPNQVVRLRQAIGVPNARSVQSLNNRKLYFNQT